MTCAPRRLILLAVVLLAAAGVAMAQQLSHAPASAPAQSVREVEEFEARANASNPPDTILEAIRVRPGMVVGEVGARHGRITIPLARRVGPGGKVYANDIDGPALAFLRDRAVREKLANIETIVGKVDDPLFPPATLDLAVMVLTYHELTQPAALLKNLASALKPGATLALVEPRVVTRAGVDAAAGPAGLELIEVNETLTARDTLYILRKR
jgi:SAM-dependent methyltransferase